jgi:hypothetical protein
MKIRLKGVWATREVWLNGRKLNPKQSQKVWNHSPDGFNWGYGGSGPSQLALAIYIRLYGVKNYGDYQEFKWSHIATLPQSDFEKEIEVQDKTLSNDTLK